MPATGRRAALSQALLAGVVQSPRDRIEEADKAGLADATAEERVGSEGPEGVVADLGIRRRCASVD